MNTAEQQVGARLREGHDGGDQREQQHDRVHRIDAEHERPAGDQRDANDQWDGQADRGEHRAQQDVAASNLLSAGGP